MVREFPVVALRNMIVFPGVTTSIDIGRMKTKQSIDAAQNRDGQILLLTQKDAHIDDPNLSDLYSIGVVALIKQVVRMPDHTYQVQIEAQQRAVVQKQIEADLLLVMAELLTESESDYESNVLSDEAKSSFEEYQRQNKNIRLDSYQLEQLRSLKEGNQFVYQASQHATWPISEKQELLEINDAKKRIERFLSLILRDLERFKLDKVISNRVKEQMDDNQREYYLREKMKAIGKELGGEDNPADIEQLREQIEATNMPEEVQQKALKELQRLERTPIGSPEVTVVRNYLDWLIELPWHQCDEEVLDIRRTREILDADHHALDDVKDRILEFLAVRQLVQEESKKTAAHSKAPQEQPDDLRAPILVLAGPPGVGKTSLGKSIARSLNRKFVRMALGGVRDEAEIRGHRRTYIGSLPGRIIQAMKTAGVMNPVILLDEIDKMSSDWRGDPSSAMLEVLDPEQNHTFQDHYLEVPYDLSQVMFITTANNLQTIPRPLLDRMEVIQIAGYTRAEKIEIAQRYRVPRQLRSHGLAEKAEITSEALSRIIEEYTQESGVRNLDRQISKFARKLAREYLEQPWEGIKQIQADDVAAYLGVPLHRSDRMEKEAQVGVAQGLAWTSVGGALLLVEALATTGTGKISMTGSLGDIMKESVSAALAYLRSHAHRYGADAGFYKGIDIHVHFPDGATPKDGPSAGITIAAAVVSAITGRPVRSDVAMTGEISLRGRVLPIGGVKEKLLAAHQGGIREVILPKENEAHLKEVPEAIKSDLQIHLFEHVSEVLDLLLLPAIEDKKPVIDKQTAQVLSHSAENQ